MTTGPATGRTDRPRPSTVRLAATKDVSTEPGVPDERGTTTLADRVVEKIAAQAATDVAHAAGLSRRLAGRTFGTPKVRCSAEVDGRVAALALDLAVEYPASARATTRSVREHVSERVATLCDLTIDHIDITVAVLRRDRADGRRAR